MQFRHACELFEYWQDRPPENELIAILAAAYTTWAPQTAKTEAAALEQHRRSLEARWKAGAMNVKQLFEASGGARAVAVRSDGTMVPVQT